MLAARDESSRTIVNLRRIDMRAIHFVGIRPPRSVAAAQTVSAHANIVDVDRMAPGAAIRQSLHARQLGMLVKLIMSADPRVHAVPEHKVCEAARRRTGQVFGTAFRSFLTV